MFKLCRTVVLTDPLAPQGNMRSGIDRANS